jgi:dethiobiotin synthetase
MTVLVVTGTGTGVGKTVVTSAIAALAIAAGHRVAVLKAAQTGVEAGQPGDVDDVRRLVGPSVTCRELARYPDPLAPATAARRAGLPPVTLEAVTAAVRELAAGHDLVLIEGAGGLLVPLDDRGGTLADVAAAVAAPVLVVAAAGLGTLNHTALTVDVLRTRGLGCIGVVIGAWPARPDLAAQCNLADLPAVTGLPLLGALREGAGCLTPGEFLPVARQGLESGLQGGGPAFDSRAVQPCRAAPAPPPAARADSIIFYTHSQPGPEKGW